MNRLFDYTIAIVLLVILIIPMIIICISIWITSRGPAVHWSNRVGRDNVNFLMPKFRSMKIDTPNLPTHLLNDPEKFLTPIGSFLRRSSLDELPQLFSIIKGDMVFVGPRPALYNQDDLIALRTKNGVSKLIPGVTGLAQVNGRDNLTIVEKVDFDIEYMKTKSLWLDIKIIWMTILKVFPSEEVSH